MLPHFNRSERRALLLGTALVLAGAAARLGLAPGEAAWAWRPADTAAASPLAEVREAVAGSRARASRAATPLAPDEKLDPNRAPEAELQRLRGVGPARARAIVEHRRGTSFRWKEDLLDVRGVGPATLERLAPHLDLPDAPAEPPAVDRSASGPTASARSAARRAAGGPGAPPPEGDRRAGAARTSGEGVGPPAGRRLDVNRADRAELEELPGVGPVLASRIVDRRRHARFRSVEDLLEVPGIGPARLAELRPRVTVR